MKKINGKEYKEESFHDFKEFLEIIEVLRSKDGCPWDREQTHESLIPCLMDEAQEVVEAIHNKDRDNLCEELGDVLLQVVLQSQIAKEEGSFTIEDVINQIAAKMIRRHPHVFQEGITAKTPEDTLELWRKVKEQEKKKTPGE